MAQKTKTVNQVVLLPVSLIYPNENQPRTVFDRDELARLSESIKENGLLQPMTVRNRGRYYELIAGERRLRALKLAGIQEAPCIIVETTEKQAAVFALLENIQRADLNYFEEAAALQNLMVEWSLSQQELGEKLGMAQSTIANKLRLLKFDVPLQQYILENGLSERHARALLRLTLEQAKEAVGEIAEKKLNVAQTERLVNRILSKKAAQPDGPEEGKKQSRHPIVKDVRLFFNTINRAISVMNESGIQASTQRVEKDDCIEYIVRIPISN